MKTIIEAVNNVCDIPTSQLPQPMIKGDRVAITISKDEYQDGLEAYKHNLHARIIWTKGITPLKVGALCIKLMPLWGITSLGKGHYDFYFTSLENSQQVM